MQATQLEVLHWSTKTGPFSDWVPTIEELRPLLSLPVLRKLGILWCIAIPAKLREEFEVARQLRGMPPLEALCREHQDAYDFVEDSLLLLE